MNPPQLSAIGLPNEMKLGTLDFSLPPDARSTSVKIQPSNISQIVSSSLNTGALTATTGTASTAVEFPFPIQNIILTFQLVHLHHNLLILVFLH